MKFMVETSARHIHLTQESVEKLFGAGHQLQPRKNLSYPGTGAMDIGCASVVYQRALEQKRGQFFDFGVSSATEW